MKIKPVDVCRIPSVKVLHFNNLKRGDKFVCAPVNFDQTLISLNKLKKLINSDTEVYMRTGGDEFDGAVSIKTGVSYSMAEINAEDYRVIKVEI